MIIAQGHLPFTESSDFGYVCLWSLKNSSYPEYVVRTHSGAICLDINRKLGYMLAVGLRDGHVAVYNASLPTSNEQYITDSIYTKHGASVRQVSREYFQTLILPSATLLQKITTKTFIAAVVVLWPFRRNLNYLMMCQ